MAINSQTGNTLLESGFFPPCRAATTAAITLAGLQTLDGVALAAGDRVLVKNQVDQTTNGIYAASTGNWVRTSDAAGNAQFFDGMAVLVAQGSQNGGLIYVCTCTDDPVVVGTSHLTFSEQGALANARFIGTSATTQTIGLGANTFHLAAGGQGFAVGQWVLVLESSAAANNILAQITNFDGSVLGLAPVATGGSGTHSDWTIVLANSAAAAGYQPPTGTGNVTGPGSSVLHGLPRFADLTGKVLEDSGIAPGTLAGRSTLQYGDAGAGSIPRAALAPNAAPVAFVAAQPTDNLVLSNDGTNPTTDIQVSPGRAPDDTAVSWLQLAATMLKRIDTAWAAGGAVGTRKGMLLTGSSWLASKTYHLWLIGAIGLSITSWSRTSNVVTVTIAAHPLGVGGTIRVYGISSAVDGVQAITATGTNTVSFANAGADTGATSVTASADGFDIGATQQDAQNYPAATLPTGFTLKQCLGSIMTDGSKNLRLFLQVGDELMWQTPILDLNNDATMGGTNRTLTVPGGLRVLARLLLNATGNSSSNPKGAIYVECPDFATGIAVQRAQLFWDLTLGSTSGNALNNANGVANVITNTSAQVKTTGNGGTMSLTTTGWRDFRRRMF